MSATGLTAVLLPPLNLLRVGHRPRRALTTSPLFPLLNIPGHSFCPLRAFIVSALHPEAQLLSTAGSSVVSNTTSLRCGQEGPVDSRSAVVTRILPHSLAGVPGPTSFLERGSDHGQTRLGAMDGSTVVLPTNAVLHDEPSTIAHGPSGRRYLPLPDHRFVPLPPGER